MELEGGGGTQRPGEKDGQNRDETVPEEQAARPGDGATLENYDCALCLRLLYEPVTLRCGHSFCGPCCANLVRAKHAKCPTCRRVLPIHAGGGSELATSLTLARLLRDVFPEEYEQRRAEISAETAPGPPRKVGRKRSGHRGVGGAGGRLGRARSRQVH